jgi:hypothetical protein
MARARPGHPISRSMRPIRATRLFRTSAEYARISAARSTAQGGGANEPSSRAMPAALDARRARMRDPPAG